jgi:hypothetical protein
MKDIREVCGVRAKPLFDAIPLAHYITPILDNYVAKLQAAAELSLTSTTWPKRKKPKPQRYICRQKTRWLSSIC